MHGLDELWPLLFYELPGVGERVLTSVLETVRATRPAGLETVAQRASQLGLPPRAGRHLHASLARHRQHCQEVAARLRGVGAWLLTPADRDYPPRWLALAEDAPPVVTGVGGRALLRAPAITVLSSRAVGEASVHAAHAAAAAAGAAGWAVVTSGNKAGYRILSIAARACGTPRVVVLDRGLLAAIGSDPARDRFGLGSGRLRLDLDTTAVVSPFRPSAGHVPHNGPRRDLLVAALCDVIVAAEVRPGGVIERTCLRALDLGRCVLSWQGAHEMLLAAGAAAAGTREELEVRMAQWSRSAGAASEPAPGDRTGSPRAPSV